MNLNILYIHQYFKTPEEGGVTRSYEIAKQLVKKGHQVTLITSWNKSHQEKKIIEGIEVIYLPVTYHNNFSFFRRILSFILFEYQAITLGKKLQRPDVIYATSTPLTVGLIGKKLASYFDCPWVFEIRDLWPEVPVQLGIIKSSILKKWLYKTEQKLLISANKTIALSPFNQKYINEIAPNKCELVTNFCNNELYQHKVNEQLVNDKFRIGYFGAISTANGLLRLVELAQYAFDMQLRQFEFVLAGQGKAENELKLLAKNLPNLTFLGHLNKEKIAETMLSCQASYISFLDHDIMQSCSPNKFFDSLAAGRLIVSNTAGWISELIKTNHCGFYAKTPIDFFEKIKPFITFPDELQKAQQNAKKLALTQFDRVDLINQIETVLLKTVKR